MKLNQINRVRAILDKLEIETTAKKPDKIRIDNLEYQLMNYLTKIMRNETNKNN